MSVGTRYATPLERYAIRDVTGTLVVTPHATPLERYAIRDLQGHRIVALVDSESVAITSWWPLSKPTVGQNNILIDSGFSVAAVDIKR